MSGRNVKFAATASRRVIGGVRRAVGGAVVGGTCMNATDAVLTRLARRTTLMKTGLSPRSTSYSSTVGTIHTAHMKRRRTARFAVRPCQVFDRRHEAERNQTDFDRAGNVFNNGYYQGYVEALDWILDGNPPRQ